MTPRTCLKCNKFFNSSGPGNRICPDCTKHTKKYRLMTIRPNPHTSAYRPDPPPELPTALEHYGKEKTTTPFESGP